MNKKDRDLALKCKQKFDHHHFDIILLQNNRHLMLGSPIKIEETVEASDYLWENLD